VCVCVQVDTHARTHTHTHARLTALCLGLPGWAGSKKVKPVWILLKQETVSGSGIRWAICKSAPCSRQITMPAAHHSSFLQAGCPSCRPTNSVKVLEAVSRYMKTNNETVNNRLCWPSSTEQSTQHCLHLLLSVVWWPIRTVGMLLLSAQYPPQQLISCCGVLSSKPATNAVECRWTVS